MKFSKMSPLLMKHSLAKHERGLFPPLISTSLRFFLVGGHTKPMILASSKILHYIGRFIHFCCCYV